MIQRRFHHIIRSEAIDSFGDHHDFVVETLNAAEVDLAMGLKLCGP